MPLLATRAAGSARGFGFGGGGEKFLDATGGTITESGEFRIHTFTSGGSFIVTQQATDPANDVVDYLLAAGGGGGGSQGGQFSGGGGGSFFFDTEVQVQVDVGAGVGARIKF